MKMTIEWAKNQIGLVRSHLNPNQIPGAYGWTCTVERLSNDKCKIALVGRAPTADELSELTDLLENEGFTEATWERYRKDKPSKTMVIRSKVA